MRQMPRRRLFNDTSTADAFMMQQQKALDAVAAFPTDTLSGSSTAAVVDAVVAEYTIHPLTLHWDDATIGSTATTIAIGTTRSDSPQGTANATEPQAAIRGRCASDAVGRS